MVPNISTKKLRRFNHILSAVIIGINLYIVSMPLLPQLVFWASSRSAVEQVSHGTTPIPSENRVVIPSLNLSEQIHEGGDESVLEKGVWRRPQGSMPGDKGNVVLAGHRFTFNDPAVFYHLDKMRPGQQIILYWEAKKFIYEVTRVYEVEPTALEVERQDGADRLTLYTCTPLWTSTNRLVVEAKPVELL